MNEITKMLSYIGIIHLFCSPYHHKAATEYLFLSSLTYQGHTSKQLASIADSCITHWLEVFYIIPLILYCEYLQQFAGQGNK